MSELNDLGMDEVDLAGRRIPTLGLLEFTQIRWRLGNSTTVEDELIGFILEFWFDPLPWFKIRLPLSVANAAEIIKQIHERLNERGLVEAARETPQDTSPENLS